MYTNCLHNTDFNYKSFTKKKFWKVPIPPHKFPKVVLCKDLV